MPVSTYERKRALFAAALSVSLVLALLSMADRYARHGWTASFYVEHEGQTVEMARSTEHRVVFPNEQRPLARYIQRWDFARFGMPSSLPELDVVLRARIRVPEGGRIIDVRSPDTTGISIDGRTIRAHERVPAGWHRLEVTWMGRFRPSNSLELRWGDSTTDLEPVPREALVPLDGSFPPLRIAFWVLALATATLLGWQSTRIVLAPNIQVRNEQMATLATALIVMLAVGYRTFDYDVMPDFRENDDERFAIWNGYSILEDGTTRGLTMWWGDYLSNDHGEIEIPQYFDRTYHVVTPYFEHPPLMHVLVGAAGHLGGANGHLEVPLAHARIVPIALSVLTLLMMIAIGRRLDPGGLSPWFGALLWAALPWIALQTRVVKEESLLTTLAVGSVLAFLRWRDDGQRNRDLVLAAVLAGLCPLTKVTGAAFIIALLILVAAEGKARAFGVALLASFITASMLLVYGAVIDWDAFVFTQGLQSGRPVHFNIFLRFFDSPLINHNLIGRGWLLFLWFAAMAGLANRSRPNVAVLAVPLMTYFAAIALGSGTWTFGWYVTPLLPFLCIGAGFFVAELWRRPDLFRGGMFIFVLVFYSLNFALDPTYVKDIQHWTDIRRWVTIVLALAIAPFGLVQAFGARFRGWARAGVALGLVLVVAMGGYFVANYDVISTQYRDFDRDRYFDR
jgi:4-amino-4-deoxy-L-arabinose transferase-like glycosyltransferase